MGEEDLGDVVRLSGQLGYLVEPGELAQRWKAVTAAAEQRVLVASHEGRTVGWTHAGVVVGLELAAYVELRALVVDQTARRTGVGRALVAEVERWAREQRVTALRVRSNIQRDEAHRFYAGLGFTLAKTQHCYVLSFER